MVTNKTGQITALYAEVRYFDTKARDLDSLATGLLTIFRSPLMSRDYSYRNDSYCGFDSVDLSLIAPFAK